MSFLFAQGWSSGRLQASNGNIGTMKEQMSLLFSTSFVASPGKPRSIANHRGDGHVGMTVLARDATQPLYG